MFCINCGARLPDGAKFCANCGARVTPAVPDDPVVSASVQETAAEVVPEGADTAVLVPETAAAAVEKVEEAVTETPEDAKEPDSAVAEEAPAVPAPAPEPAPEPVPEAVAAPAPEPVPEPVPERVEERVPAAAVAPAYAAPAAPVYSAPAPEPVHTPEKAPAKGKKAAKAPVKGNAGRIVLSVFLSILLCVSILVSSLVTIVKLTVTDDNMAAAIQSIRFSTLKLGSLGDKKSDRVRITGRSVTARTLSAPAAGGLEVLTVSSRDRDDDDLDLDDLDDIEDLDDLAGYLYDLAKDKPGWEDVEKKDIEKALDDPLVDQFLTEIATDYTDVLVKGEKGTGKGLTPERITDFVVEHEDEIRRIAEDAGFKGELKIDERKLEESIRQEIGDSYAPERITEEYSDYVDAFRLVVSLPVVIALWAVTALLIVLLILVNKRRISAVLSCVGIPALIVGLLFLAAWAAMTFLPQMKDSLLSLIPSFFGRYLLYVGAGLAGGGLLFILIKAVIRAVQRKKRSA